MPEQRYFDSETQKKKGGRAGVRGRTFCSHLHRAAQAPLLVIA